MVSALGCGDRSPQIAGGAGGTRGGSRGWNRQGWLTLVLACAPALSLLSGLGCNRSLNFFDPLDAATGVQVLPTADAAVDASTPGNDGPSPDLAPVPDAAPDLPVDLPVDMPVDRPPDVPPTDVPVDRTTDVPRDVPPDLPPDLPRDAGGPVVCTASGGECKLPGLFCLVASGSTGRCVECTGTGAGQCPSAASHCDPTLNRCIECLADGDCPGTGGEAEHPSTCTIERHCLNACDDSSSTTGTCVKAGFTCNGGGDTPDHVCVGCMVASDCPRPFCTHNICMQCGSSGDCVGQAGPICDSITGNCVQCADSRDCRTAGLPLCNPVSHTCVAVPP